MPFPNEHAARLRDPNTMDDDSFRRVNGGSITLKDVGRVEVPESIAIIFGKLKGAAAPDDPPLAQSLRFPTETWTEAEARKWLSDRDIKPMLFEKASGSEHEEDEEKAAFTKNLKMTACLENDGNRRQFINMSGLWSILPSFAVTLSKIEASRHDDDELRRILFTKSASGIAIIEMNGPMTKGMSFFSAFFGGVDTLLTIRAIQEANADESVEQIVLKIDSPGGHVAGTAELADAVASSLKPVIAFADDLMASAAFWVGSQASSVFANASAEIGSIGTVAVVEDTSQLMENIGVKVHVIATGDFKGAFMEGVPVEESHLEDMKERVFNMNIHFLNAVQVGRGLSKDQLEAVSDGRVFSAKKAQSLGLIDKIMSFGHLIDGLDQKLRSRKRSKLANARIKLSEY